MTHKKLLRPDRPRQIPPHFSWVDHQLIRQHRLRDCDHSAWALYLFLVTVADAQGLSYYSEKSTPPAERGSKGPVRSVADILRQALGGAA